MTNPRSQLLRALLDEYWISDDWVDPLGPLLDGWSAEQADGSYASAVNAVATIVNHTAFWEGYLLRALTGPSMDGLAATEEAVEGQSPSRMPAWPGAVAHCRDVHGQLESAVNSMEDDDWLAGGTILHHAYHMGQLVLLIEEHTFS